MTTSNGITHVIYDLDGLLLDTEPFYTKVTQIIAESYGKVFDWSIKSRTIGRRAEDSARHLVNALSLPITPSQYLEARKQLLDELFPKAQPMAGAVRLTQHLHRHGIPQAVATSSDRRTFELKISCHKEWFRIFECLVQGDDTDVRNGKPAPDIFLVAAQRMKALPENCLVFEDAPAGVQAARAAGMYVVVVPDPNLDPLACPEAHKILNSLDEFDPTSWGLPSY